MSIGVVAGMTIREASRRKILLAAVLLGGAFVGLYGLGLYLIGPKYQTLPLPPIARRQATNVLLMMGLYAVNWLMVAVTILVSVDTLAGEIASGTIQSVVTKPIRRWQVVFGKWLGFAALLTPFLLLLAGGVIGSIRLFTDYLPPNAPQAVALMWLESLLLLTVTFRAGASLTTLATGVAAFGLHVLAFLGGWIEEFGFLGKSDTAVNIGTAVSLVLPSEALWRRAAATLQGPTIGGFGRSPFNVGSVPSDYMVAYAGLYLAVVLALAVRRFGRRDL